LQQVFTDIPTKTLVEQKIVALLHEGDKQSVRLIFKHYGVVLLNVIQRVVGNRAMAEEVLQQVLLKVWQNAQSYNAQKAGLYSWLVAISRNAALDQRKTKDFKLTQASRDALEVMALENKADASNSIDKMVTEQLLEQLSDHYQILIKMSFFEGYSHQEISDTLNIPLGTVKTRIRMALKQLRAII
tara:strand:+ start:5175 stop:5732 length:558 start_codon:yes stop_codon:yes gene_type:complete